jgi:hypothetical protein
LVDAQLLEPQGSSMTSLSMDLEPTMKSSYSDVHPVLFAFLKMSMKDSGRFILLLFHVMKPPF